MANAALVKEKAKADKEIRKEIAKTAAIVAALAYPYKSLGYGFSFDANGNLAKDVNNEFGKLRLNIFGLIRDRSIVASEISTKQNIELYGLDAQMSEEEIEDFLLSDIEGKTTKDRIGLYVGQVRGEMESYIAAALVLGLSSTKIWQSFIGELLSPYSSKMMMDAMVSGMFSAVRLRRGELKYGSGRYASGFKNLLRTDIDVTQRTYIQATIKAFMSNSKIAGIRPYRNSIISCELCDSVAGRVYAVDSGIVPVHSRCICGCTPVMADGTDFSDAVF